MSVQLELERTFLARYIPAQIGGAPSDSITDIYIPDNVEHAELRLRKKDEQYSLTKKELGSDGDSSQQTEHAVPLSKEEYQQLKRLSSKRLRKRRFYTTYYGNRMEIDVFRDELEGLVMIDFEFDSQQTMQAFQPPEVCLTEVTQEDFIAGGKLAGKRFEDLHDYLQKHQYQPLFIDREDFQGEVSTK